MSDIPTRDEPPSFTERFRDKVCKFKPQLTILLVVELALFLFVLVSFPFVDRGSSSWVILQFDVIIIGTTSAMVVGALYVCRGE
jgi:hypothetical protein